jgi:hypothetical protein
MNKIFSIAAFIVGVYFPVRAQDVPVHAKKVYVSPEGKIFYNKSLPVYFYISTSSDANAPHYLLKSEATPKYANPMYFDTEGKNTLRSPSAVDTVTRKLIMPKMDVQFQLYVDSKPPLTEILFDRHKESLIHGLHYIPDSVSVSFKAVDELSGVENTYVSIDSGAFTPSGHPIRLDREKEYAIKYYSVDNTGNAEHLKGIKFFTDKTPPTSKLDINGPNHEDVLSGDVVLSISAEDKISGVKHIYISIDDSIFHPYTKKISTVLLQQGEHKLYYYSTDKVDNIEKVNTYVFYVDKTPPQVIEEIMGKTFIANGKEFSAGTSKLKITSFDNKAGVKEIYYSINNSPYVKYEKPIVLSGYKGDLLVNSYGVDNVGNKSRSDASNARKNNIPYVDLGAPWVGHSFKGPIFINRDTVFVSQKTNIALDAKDTESGIDRIEYQVDTGSLAKYEAPFTISKEGYHHISVFGYDNTQNLTRQEFGIVVDTTGPQIFERFSSPSNGTFEVDNEKLELYSNPIVVFLSATDSKSGYEALQFELNNNPVLPYTRDVRGFVPDKKNTIRVRAFDKLGNQTEKIIEFYIK